jgi:hypothetical protein
MPLCVYVFLFYCDDRTYSFDDFQIVQFVAILLAAVAINFVSVLNKPIVLLS